MSVSADDRFAFDVSGYLHLRGALSAAEVAVVSTVPSCAMSRSDPQILGINADSCIRAIRVQAGMVATDRGNTDKSQIVNRKS